MSEPERRPETHASASESALAGLAMSWSGWGSPVGLGIFLVCLALALGIGRFVLLGPWF